MRKGMMLWNAACNCFGLLLACSWLEDSKSIGRHALGILARQINQHASHRSYELVPSMLLKPP